VGIENFDQYIRYLELKREMVPSFSSYPFSLPAIKDFRQLHLHSKVTFVIGENGTGKSTLLEAIAVAYGFNPEGGTRNFNFSTRETHSELNQYIRLVKGVKRPKDGFFLRAESFYNVATQIDDLNLAGFYGGVSLHQQSHGESFLAVILNRFSGNGIYILDEPEAALSPMRQMSLLARINELVRLESQFIIATHSPIIMAYPDADIYCIDQGFKKVKYEDTEHYQVMRNFINNPKKMVDILME
jgi:predicted ATPase